MQGAEAQGREDGPLLHFEDALNVATGGTTAMVAHAIYEQIAGNMITLAHLGDLEEGVGVDRSVIPVGIAPDQQLGAASCPPDVGRLVARIAVAATMVIILHVTERIDLDEFEKLAKEHKPKLIVAGASAYPRVIDFEKMAAIAQLVK